MAIKKEAVAKGDMVQYRGYEWKVMFAGTNHRSEPILCLNRQTAGKWGKPLFVRQLMVKRVA